MVPRKRNGNSHGSTGCAGTCRFAGRLCSCYSDGTCVRDTTPVLVGLICLIGGLIAFFAFSVLDKKLDRQIEAEVDNSPEEKFSFKDVAKILSNPGFWLIALLCVLFYSCVFPFQKFASELMISKYGIDESVAGFFAGLPALGALFLTPVFGGMVDKRGKAASIMMLGAAMLIAVHCIYALPFITSSWIAIVLMIALGIAFSLVPSAMWPRLLKYSLLTSWVLRMR